MASLNFMEEYFIRMHKIFGISKLNFEDNKVKIEDDVLKNMVFASDEFNHEFENLLEQCRFIYGKIKRDFSLKVKKDINNDYFVLVA